MTVLALLQAIIAVQLLGFALAPPVPELRPTLDAAYAAAFGILALASLVVLPRVPPRYCDVSIAATWLLLALVVATRVTAEGQIVIAMSVLLLVVYACYCRPVRIAVVHLIGTGVAVAIALLVNPLQSSPFFVMLVTVTIGVTAWVVVSLRERDRHLRLLLENAADVVFHTRYGIFQWVSPSAYETLGWQPSDLVGTRKVDLWHPEDRPRGEALRERTKVESVSTETMRLRRPDGQYIWIEATLRPYVDAYNQPGISGSMRDVSDRVAARAALQQSEADQRALAEQLSHAAATQARLMQNISHEFRTPLTVMRAPLQRLARRSAELEADDRVELEAALRASRRLTRLVDDLVETSRGDSAAAVTIREPVDVAAATIDSVELYRSVCDAAGITLTVTLTGVPELVWLHQDAWSRIVSNLVSNAVRFTRAGSIRVVVGYDEPTLCLDVIDTGIGIADEDTATVFGRFEQGSRKPVRGGAGTGIGLAMVRELALDLGGDSRIDTNPHGGTRVCVHVHAPRWESSVSVVTAGRDSVEGGTR